MRIGRFGIVSGLGWLIDFGLFTALSWSLLPPYGANLVGATCAICFVFFVSTKRVFFYEGGYVWAKLVAYLLFQAVVVTVFSALIQTLVTAFGLLPPLAKVLVTPFNFYVNFLFMSYLLTGRVRAY